MGHRSLGGMSSSSSRPRPHMARDLMRRVRDLAGAGGPAKLALFLVLACVLGILVFYTPNETPPPPPVHTATVTSAGAKADSKSGVAAGAEGVRPQSAKPPPIVTARVLTTFPHDPAAFTQGLLVQDGMLWEGTGLYGSSQLRKVDLASGRVLESFSLPSREFGEGLTIFDNQLIQITWQDHVAYVYDIANFTLGPRKTFRYKTEGWGITHDDEHLLLSDGTNHIYFLSPETFQVQRRLSVRWMRNGKLHPVAMLNELEYINGVIYANVWMTNFIVLIDPQTGLVRKVIDATALHPNPTNGDMTLNGIAWDADQRKLYITGKLWPQMFEIEFVGLDDAPLPLLP